MVSLHTSNLTQKFIIVGLIGLISLVAVLGSFHRSEEVSNLLSQSENKNINLVQTLRNSFLEDYVDYIEDYSSKTSNELMQESVVRDFDKRVRAHLAKLDVHLVSILSLDGLTIFSTNPHMLAARLTEPEVAQAMESKKPVSKLQYHELIKSLESLQVHKYVVTSYIPLFITGESELQGLVEIQYDVTDFVNSIDKQTSYNYLVIASLLLVFLMVLFIFVSKAEYVIKTLSFGLKKQDKLIQQQKHRDALTGLPNRLMFKDRLEHEMKLSKLNNNLLALLFMDLDYFQKVNDALGYETGDKLLIEVSERLKQCVRSGDIVGRIGGDEFVIILRGINVLDEAEEVARQILSSISEVYSFDEKELFVSFSIGIAMYPFAEEDANSLTKKANSAMNKAKLAGRNTFRYFTESTRKQLISRFSTENSLRRALEREEFELYFQPIVQLKTGRIVSVEALLRWNSSDQGFMSPAEFVPLLEETGLIIPVGQWVLENACKQGVIWNQDGINDLKINVNMSARQLLHKDLIKQVNDALDMSGLSPHLLDLELTESLLIEDFSNTIHILENLNDVGISLSIDDFGTGYSSLSYLKRMPVDTLKIDQSFVRDIAVNIDDAAIVEAICALSKSLRFKVTAEGLETSDQLEYLRRAGVNQVQGFLLSKPVPASELEPLLRQKKILIASDSAA